MTGAEQSELMGTQEYMYALWKIAIAENRNQFAQEEVSRAARLIRYEQIDNRFIPTHKAYLLGIYRVAFELHGLKAVQFEMKDYWLLESWAEG